jgi:hypothetical protein
MMEYLSLQIQKTLYTNKRYNQDTGIKKITEAASKLKHMELI